MGWHVEFDWPSITRFTWPASAGSYLGISRATCPPHIVFTFRRRLLFLFGSTNMFSRLSRYFSRSKRRNEHTDYKPLSAIPPQIPLPFRFQPTTPHSLIRSFLKLYHRPRPGVPSFLQVVCNDSQTIYCHGNCSIV